MRQLKRRRIVPGGGTTLDDGADPNVVRLDGTSLYRALEEDHLGIAAPLANGDSGTVAESRAGFDSS